MEFDQSFKYKTNSKLTVRQSASVIFFYSSEDRDFNKDR